MSLNNYFCNSLKEHNHSVRDMNIIKDRLHFIVPERRIKKDCNNYLFNIQCKIARDDNNFYH